MFKCSWMLKMGIFIYFSKTDVRSSDGGIWVMIHKFWKNWNLFAALFSLKYYIKRIWNIYSLGTNMLGCK